MLPTLDGEQPCFVEEETSLSFQIAHPESRTCICIDSFTLGGTWMSLISYRRHRMPQQSEAWLIASTMLALRDSRSWQAQKKQQKTKERCLA